MAGASSFQSSDPKDFRPFSYFHWLWMRTPVQGMQEGRRGAEARGAERTKCREVTGWRMCIICLGRENMWWP